MSSPRIAMISGANRGIGAAVSEALYAAGWNVSLGMREPQMPTWAADPARICLYRYDAREGLENAWAAETVAKFGGIDAVVANAGIVSSSGVIAAEDDELNNLLDVNVKAPRRLVKAAWAELGKTGRGRVIILASLSGKRVKSIRSGLYAMSKFAAVALAHGIRHEGFDLGIRATAICPGFVATDMARSISDREEKLMTDPRDIARIIVMLLDLPNEASVAEFAINCQLEETF
ncbi:SDR family NAD(P)-dependent oxidoreductase [Mesorhizobium sp. SB112]|uniref:SDR family NAD(P)-dependent oxidoreductase n=1 Tax=Mesorhizobium sp. SB112 TaxID=3151853 RepID=UPI003264C927